MIWVAGQIGWWTLLAVLGTSLIGLAVLGITGKNSTDQLRSAIRSESLDHLKPANTGLAVAGGMLLLLPGFITDVIGALMVIPFTQPIFRKLLGWYGKQLTKPIVGQSYPPQTNIIPGEVVEEGPQEDENGPLVIEGTVIDDGETQRG